MCDTYIEGIGYVCRECQEEFKLYLQKTNINVEYEYDIVVALNIFMSIPKGRYSDSEEMTVDKFFSKHTRNND